jgi:hypothetical protein
MADYCTYEANSKHPAHELGCNFQLNAQLHELQQPLLTHLYFVFAVVIDSIKVDAWGAVIN